jgi:TPR repeat protein
LFLFFCFFLLLCLQARDAAKSATVLFHEAMEEVCRGGVELDDCLSLLEKAAAKGHEESIWILNVVKDVELYLEDWKKAFVATGEPLGWFFAGMMCAWPTKEQFEFLKLSAEGGCSWGQVGYGDYFEENDQNEGIVEEDNNTYMEWLVTAANQNNPRAIEQLGRLFKNRGDFYSALEHHHRAAELGWENSMEQLVKMYRDGNGCEKDLRQAAMWSAQSDPEAFWNFLKDSLVTFLAGEKDNLNNDFDQLCYTLGWGLYWYEYDADEWKKTDLNDLFGSRCLKYYCLCVELQQKSIVTFSLCWNKTVGAKAPGQLIARMVWAEREDNLMKSMLGTEPMGCVLETDMFGLMDK